MCVLVEIGTARLIDREPDTVIEYSDTKQSAVVEYRRH